MKKINTGVDIGLLILRLSVGTMLLIHGISKLVHGIDGIKMMLEKMGFPSVIAYGVFVGEVIAPLLLILGYKTRLAAGVIAFNMTVAIIMAHSSGIFSLSATGGWSIELPALYLFSGVALVFTGAGIYSVDRCQTNLA